MGHWWKASSASRCLGARAISVVHQYVGAMLLARVSGWGVGVVVATALLTGSGTAHSGDRPDADPHSVVVPKFLANGKTVRSWNPNVSCRATRTTLRRVLGTEQGASGGATFNGGGFKPGIPDRRALQPPCSVDGVPTFVQLNRVQVGACTKIMLDGDWTCPLWDPNLTGVEDMRRIVIETDEKFRALQGWSVPPTKTAINVQGFVFWDPDHTEAGWHNHSGWEIHSFTAWRLAA